MDFNQMKVREFHEAMGHPVAKKPTTVSSSVVRFRYDRIAEELTEYKDAALDGDLVGIADALADLLYVVYGAALVHGIDLQPIFNAVHRSNMTKLDENGNPVPHPTIPDKAGKSELYREPTKDIEAELEAQSEQY